MPTNYCEGIAARPLVHGASAFREDCPDVRGGGRGERPGKGLRDSKSQNILRTDGYDRIGIYLLPCQGGCVT
jgi:hypothetical protein